MAGDFIIIDAGPIVALLSKRDQYHAWAIDVVKEVEGPYLTSEAVLSEAFHLVEDLPAAKESLLVLLDRREISVFSGCDEIEDIAKLMRRYSDQPMSLADATLVRFAELHDNVRVFTADRHFRIYRRNRRQLIPLIAPWTDDAK